MSPLPPVSLRHLMHLMGPHGLFEHAETTTPRTEHGYCTDDNARLLVVTARQPDTGDGAALSRRALAFVLSALVPDGRCHNRMDPSGAWTDEATTDDCWGRSLWALGVASTRHGDPTVRDEAMRGFTVAAAQSARSPRSMAFAALGAADVASRDARNPAAVSILQRTMSTIGAIPSGAWCWPEPRLAYANAVLAEALIAAGSTMRSAWDVERGLRMLAWLMDRETKSGHLSVTPVGGSGPDDRGPQFDQQPIEAAALADACARAFEVTGDAMWTRGITAAAQWFVGANDANLPMYDPTSFGGYDGLHEHAVNANQGAESTLAFVSTMQRAHAFVPSA